MRLSLVVPAYNESHRLRAGFERLQPHWSDDDEHEIVMVDDGSTDDTLRVAHEVYGSLRHFSLVRQEVNRGKGAAVRVGLAQARGDHVIVADADMAIHPRHFVDIDAALEVSPLAPGVRDVTGTLQYSRPWRTWGGHLHHALVQRSTGVTLRDTQCGCKGYRLAEGRLLALFGFIERFSVDAETFYLAGRLGFTYQPVPVTWDDVPGSSVRLLSTFRTAWRDVREIPRTTYRNPAVRVDPHLDSDVITGAVRGARLNGTVLARGGTDALVVLARHDALGALSVAEALSGTLTTVSPEDVRGRVLEAL